MRKFIVLAVAAFAALMTFAVPAQASSEVATQYCHNFDNPAGTIGVHVCTQAISQTDSPFDLWGHVEFSKIAGDKMPYAIDVTELRWWMQNGSTQCQAPYPSCDGSASKVGDFWFGRDSNGVNDGAGLSTDHIGQNHTRCDFWVESSIVIYYTQSQYAFGNAGATDYNRNTATAHWAGNCV